MSIELAGHALACPLLPEKPPEIRRHRAALSRKTVSRPTRLALEAGLLPEEGSFFDYGCGQGQDQREIAQRGYPSAGWDPHYAPIQPEISGAVYLADFGEPGAWAEQFQGLDALIHLAGDPRPNAPEASTYRNNFRAASYVFEAARQAGAKTS